MRGRTALAILIAVNVLWGAAFFGYIHRSTTPVMKPREETPAAKPIVAASNAPAPVVAATPATNPVPLAAPITNVAARAPKSLPSADKKFGWQDVTNETYLDY